MISLVRAVGGRQRALNRLQGLPAREKTVGGPMVPRGVVGHRNPLIAFTGTGIIFRRR
jgi:hypothetical protein